VCSVAEQNTLEARSAASETGFLFSAIGQAAIGASACDLALRVECFGAVGLPAIHSSTSASSHARAFGVINLPSGKLCSRISRHNVIREATTPFATRSLYRISFTVLPHLVRGAYRRRS
jgi:hypothetical protein